MRSIRSCGIRIMKRFFFFGLEIFFSLNKIYKYVYVYRYIENLEYQLFPNHTSEQDEEILLKIFVSMKKEELYVVFYYLHFRRRFL